MLTRKVYELIKNDLLSCRLAPGTMVTESQLSERHDTGKTPVREALTILQSEGFVRILPRRGILVEPIHSTHIQHTYFLRSLVEPAAAALAAQRARMDDISEIEAILEEAAPADLIGKELDPEHLRKHSRFHVALAELTGIPRLVSLIQSLHDDVERFFNYNSHLGTMLRFGSSDHELLDAVAANDPERAEKIARRSLAVSRRKLIEALLGDHFTESDASQEPAID